MNLKSKSDSENIRLYLDNNLHLRIPRDKNIKLQSWIDNSTKLHYIELWCVNHSILIEYENKELWCDVLNELDKII